MYCATGLATGEVVDAEFTFINVNPSATPISTIAGARTTGKGKTALANEQGLLLGLEKPRADKAFTIYLG